MQFYIVHEDPIKSAKMLPDYALKQVNLREGWQIISDIAHIVGVEFQGQNKLYSDSHALTLQLCSSSDAFKLFIEHYKACCLEYKHRYKCTSSFIDKFFSMRGELWNRISGLLPNDKYEATRRYLLYNKGSKLTDEDRLRLTEEFI